ncbi:MAG: hypothetical protein ACLTSD_09255 [Eubacterium sp.]
MSELLDRPEINQLLRDNRVSKVAFTVVPVAWRIITNPYCM